ncbi:unnamed protein product [Prunus armeniaca]|uniref:Uncharacterized protein n=1 Tax=Prunus armeniaca TaxID=36596 RepID=A0A6J5X741_PRUAR|nr:unnamed protein product [Prunus armeniaca]
MVCNGTHHPFPPNLSNELAARGHRISFLVPKKALLELQHLNLHPNLITFHTITFPHIEGLPEGTEIASDIPTSICNGFAQALYCHGQQKSKESLSKAVTTVMDKDNKVAVMVKNNHAEWRKILFDPGLKSGYVDKLV